MESIEIRLQELQDRFGRLEKQNRRWKRSVLGVALIAGCVLAMGQARPARTITADKFVLKDSQGRVRVQLFMDEYGPSLAMFDADGKKRIELAAIGDFAQSLEFLSPDGKSRASLISSDDIGPRLFFYDKSGPAQLAIEENGDRPAIKFYQPSSKEPLAQLSTDGLALFDNAYQFRVLLGGGESEQNPMVASPRLLLFGAGKASVSIDGDEPSISVQDGEGFNTIVGKTKTVTTKTGEKQERSAASVMLFGKDGKVLWSAP